MQHFWQKAKIVIQEKQKRQTTVLIILMIISAFLEVCGISTVLPVLSALLDRDFMFQNRYAVLVCSVLGINSYRGFVIACIGILLAVFLIKNAILILKDYYQARFALEFQHDLRKKILHIYINKNYHFFLNTNSADINKTILDDVGNNYAVFDNLLRIMTVFIVDVFLMAAIFIIDWKLSLGMLVIVILVFFGITIAIRPTIKKSSTQAYFAMIDRNKWIYQTIQGIKTVKVTEKGPFFEKKELDADLEFSRAERNHLVLSRIPRMLIEMISIASLVILITIFVINGSDFESMIPGIGAIGLAAVRILPSVNTIITSIAGIQYRIPSIYKVSDLISEAESEQADGPFPEVYKNSIDVDHISFRYDDETRLILDDATLSIPIGKMTGIIGPSGEGKTTFADIFLGLLLPCEGRILADGTDIQENLRRWRQSIGYITQNIFLLDDSVLANVAFGADEDDIDENAVWEALEKAQIADFVRTLPEGLNTKIGERGVRLSGGQCQRIGIARAIYNNPQIMIFDEATSSLDTETETEVVNAINRLYGEHTIIVIAHRSKALEQCDEIFKIKNGKLFPSSI